MFTPEVQTRSETGALCYFDSINAAKAHARQDSEVWKISFTNKAGNRMRFVHDPIDTSRWKYTPMLTLKQILNGGDFVA